MTEETKLLPCPFCGGKAERIEIEEGDEVVVNIGGSIIECTQCHVSSPVHFERKENLVSSWNTRALSPPEPTEGQLLMPSECSRVMYEAFTAELPAIEIGWMALRRGYKAMATADRTLPLQDHSWRPIPAPNDSAFRWYGLHVQHSGGYSWFEAHYVAHVDGQMLHPSGDNFDDWAFTDFEFWCDAPPIPAMVAEDQTSGAK